jgi:hypothetical protein
MTLMFCAAMLTGAAFQIFSIANYHYFILLFLFNFERTQHDCTADSIPASYSMGPGLKYWLGYLLFGRMYFFSSDSLTKISQQWLKFGPQSLPTLRLHRSSYHAMVYTAWFAESIIKETTEWINSSCRPLSPIPPTTSAIWPAQLNVKNDLYS